MERSTWITIIAVTGGVGLAIYFGLNTSPTSSPVSIQTPSTASIDYNNQLTQATLQELTTQQQILNQLQLGTSVSTPLSSNTTASTTGVNVT